MIKKFKKLFSIQSEFQNFLVKCSLTKDNYVYKQEDADSVIPFMTDENNINEFFSLYQDDEFQTYTIRMKMLITVHQLINTSDEFAIIFSKTHFSMFKTPTQKKETFVFKQVTNEVWLLESIQIPFLQYLQKIALNISDIKSYRNHHFRKQIIQPNLVVDCFKLENLVNHGLSIVPQLKTALTNFPHDFLLKRLACNLYSELRQFQRQLINSLSALLDANSQATNIEIFEFFREVQNIEKKTMQFYVLHKLYDPGKKLMPPLQLKIDIKSAKHLEQQAIHEQQKLNAIKQQRSQRQSRANSTDILNRSHQGFISQRERKFQMHARAKKQDTIQEDIELPTEEQQQAQPQEKSENLQEKSENIPQDFEDQSTNNIRQES